MPDAKHANQLPRGPFPAIGSKWRHYKGDIYTVVLVSIDEATGAVLVHYESEEGRAKGWVPWSRPLLGAKNAFWGLVSEEDLARAGVCYVRGVKVQRFTEVK